MTASVLVALQLFGLFALVAGVIALIRNRRDSRADPPSALVRASALAAGAFLAVLSVFGAYSLGDTHRIIGFPFVAAAWEKHGAHWEDFVGPLTVPAFIANAAVAFTLPQLLLRLARSRTGPLKRHFTATL